MIDELINFLIMISLPRRLLIESCHFFLIFSIFRAIIQIVFLFENDIESMNIYTPAACL